MTLTADERRALAPISALVDLRRVRVHRGRGSAAADAVRRAVLAVSGGRACALGNHVFLPDRALGDVAVLAHEATHCGQYQRWGALRYFARGALEQYRYRRWRRSGAGINPYAYAAVPGRPFASYGMEQQGQLVEDAFRGRRGALMVLRPVTPAAASPRAHREAHQPLL